MFKTKIFLYKNGYSVTVEKTHPYGYYVIRLYDSDDVLIDKLTTDTLQPHLREFKQLARRNK